MAYSRKRWLKLTQDTIDLLDAINEEDLRAVADISEKISKYRRSNPDWAGTALTVGGHLLQISGNPAAVALGTALTTTARVRSVNKALSRAKK